MDAEENFSRQNDEIEALSAIYGDNWIAEEDTRSYGINLLPSGGDVSYLIKLRVNLPPTYPTQSPPIYELNAPWLKGPQRVELSNSLEKIYLDNIGEDIIFLWAEAVREYVQNVAESNVSVEETKETSTDEIDHTNTVIVCPEIYHGEPIQDRKSTFQAHIAKVRSVDEVNAMKYTLLQNKKIAHATHNILAYRINTDGKSWIQDCDDDGENAAGGRLLHLLQILNVENVAVIVSRWYGGILLGPDRFKHINNAARNTLQSQGFISIAKQSKTK